MGVLPGTKQIPTPVAKGGAFAIPLLIPVQYSLSFVAVLFNVRSWELFEEGNCRVVMIAGLTHCTFRVLTKRIWRKRRMKHS